MRSVAGIAIREGKVFVARRMPGGQIGLRWEFPGGKLEPGENGADAVRREFHEEFGLEVSPGRILGSTEFTHQGGDVELIALLVGFIGEPETLAEHGECRWVDSRELAALDLADSDRALLGLVVPLLGDGGVEKA